MLLWTRGDPCQDMSAGRGQQEQEWQTCGALACGEVLPDEPRRRRGGAGGGAPEDEVPGRRGSRGVSLFGATAPPWRAG